MFEHWKIVYKKKKKHCKLVSNPASETKNKKRIHARVSKNKKKIATKTA